MRIATLPALRFAAAIWLLLLGLLGTAFAAPGDFDTRFNHPLFAPLFAADPCNAGPGVLGGTLFGDFNQNGLNDQQDGIAGAKVYLYGCDGNSDGALLDSTLTDELGQYYFTGLVDGDSYYLEAQPVAFPAYTPAPIGADHTGLKATATAPSCGINMAAAAPEDFNAATPFVLASCFVGGDPLANGGSTEEVLVAFPWNAGASTTPTKLADAGDMGAVYGIAYDDVRQRAYAAAFLKRHAGLGAQGLGGLYEMDLADLNVPSVAASYDLTTLGLNFGTIPANGVRGLQADPSLPSNDADAYALIGKAGMGGLAYDAATATLYFINLHDRTLYSLDRSAGGTPVAADLTTYTVPNPGCPNGTWRPFAVSVYRGEVYVGGVCDAATGTNADLTAYVYKMTAGVFNTTPVIAVPLDYQKGYAAYANDCKNIEQWFGWSDVLPTECSAASNFYVYPQPILSDLAFDVDGSIILGFMDRLGHQLGYQNNPPTGNNLITGVSGGDVLRAHYTGGAYVLESNGAAGARTGSGMGNTEGPGGGEFYGQDWFLGVNNSVPAFVAPHVETSQGGVATYPGSGELLSAALDPYNTTFNSGGINWFSNVNGVVRDPGFRLYVASNSNNSTFGKANGVGATKLMRNGTAPLQIAGYAWQDDNDSGTQEACEAPIAGLAVELYNNAGTQVASTTTGANGFYVFETGLTENTDYIIAFGTDGAFDLMTGELNGSRYLSMADQGTGTYADRRDSDATFAPGSVAGGSVTGYPHIAVRTGVAGVPVHYADAGFGLAANAPAGISGTVFIDENNNDQNDAGDGTLSGVTVRLLDAANSAVLETVTSGAGGVYAFPNLMAGNYIVAFDASSVTPSYEAVTADVGPDATDSDADATTGRTTSINFDPNNGSEVYDAGYRLLAGTISGRVFEDDNMNGIRNSTDADIGDVRVDLFDAVTMTSIANTISGSNGIYAFTNVVPGDYYLIFDPTNNNSGVSNYQPTSQNAGSDPTIDSDIDGNNQISTFTFDPGNGPLENLDAGYVIPSGNITGMAFLDANEDGIQESMEIGIQGVRIELVDAATDAVESIAFTDNNGIYFFLSVGAGTYYLRFDESNNSLGLALTGSPQNVGNDETVDSDPTSLSGVTDDFTFDPVNGNLMDMDAGYFEPSGTFSGFVWLDVNQNGLQDAGEEGIPGVTVYLQSPFGQPFGDVVSDANGFYSFDMVTGGSYQLRFDETTTGNPDYSLTQGDVGTDDTIDSDVDPNSNLTAPLLYDPVATPVLDQDAGYTLPFGQLSGQVFFDTDQDGVLNNGESGYAIAEVTLAGTDLSGNPTTATIPTNSDGTYLFATVTPGTYTLSITVPDTPSGLAITSQNAGTDDTIDSDVDEVSGSTAAITVNGGDIITNVDAGLIDVENPTFDDPPGDLSGECDDVSLLLLPTVTASDNLDTDVTVELTSTESGDFCTGRVITRVYTATDDSGNSTVHTQTITLTDTSDPVFTYFPADTTIQCVDLPDGDPKAVDNCDTEVTITDVVVSSGSCPTIFERTYTAEDDCGNAISRTQIITQVDTVAPTITPIHPDLVGLMDGDTLYLGCNDIPALYLADDAVADDACSTAEITDFEDLLLIQGDCADDGYLMLMSCRWVAEDACGNQGFFTFFILQGDFDAPVLSNVPADVTVECGMVPPAPTDVAATDECTEDLELEFFEVIIGDTCETYKIIRKWETADDCGNFVSEQHSILVEVDSLQLQGVPEDFNVDCEDGIPTPPTVTATPDCYSPVIEFEEQIIGDTCRDYQRLWIWTATNSCGKSTSDSTLLDVSVDEVMLIGVPDDITITCDDELPVPAEPTPTGADCYETTVDFMEEVQGDSCTDYQLVRIWTATTSCGEVLVESQIINVEVPELELVGIPGDISINCQDPVPTPAEPMATSECYETDIEFAEIETPGDCPQEYTITRTWTATNSCGERIDYTRIITIVDEEAPMITFDIPMMQGVANGDSITIQCDEVLALTEESAIVTDNCDDDPEVTFIEETMLGSCEDDGYLLRMLCCWRVKDACGNADEFCVIVRITDSEAPVLSETPADMTISFENGDVVPPVPTITATDNCADAEVIYTSSTEAQDCGYVEVRTWMAEDDCGNQVMHMQTITVEDICDCPAVIVDGYEVTPAGCGSATGSLAVNLSVSPTVYDWLLVPNFGTFTGSGYTDLPAGSYLLVLNVPNADDCEEKYYFDITQEGCNQTVALNIQGATQICLDDYDVFNYDGTITSAAFCDAGDDATVQATSLDNECLTLEPADGFEGSVPGKICVIHCFDGSSLQCDTTYLEITVSAPAAPDCGITFANELVNPAGCGANDGSISFIVDGAEGDLIYVWDGAVSTTNAATDLTPGTYGVTITDELECSATASFTVEETATNGSLQNEPFTTTNPTCAGAADGSIDSDLGAAYSLYLNDQLIGELPQGNLPAGTYEVREACKVPAVIVLEAPAELDVQVMTTPVSCAGNDGTAVLVPSGGTAPYTYAWSPNVSTDNDASGLALNVAYAVTVTDANGCTFAIEELLMDDDCDCDIELFQVAKQDATCGEANGSIEVGVTGNVSSNLEYTWAGNIADGPVASELSAGFYSVTVTDLDSGCDGSLAFIINNDETDCGTSTDACAGFLPEGVQIATTANCGPDAVYCLDLPLTESFNYDITHNGAAYTGGLAGCDFDTTLAYSYFSIPNQGTGGVYSVNNWSVNGVEYTGTFSSLQELVDDMNGWDATATWTLDEPATSIVGGNPATTYSNLMVTQQSDGATATLELNVNFIPNGTALTVGTGTHELIFTHPDTQCADTLNLQLVCITTETLLDTVLIDQTHVFCIDDLDASQLPGTPSSFLYSCIDCDNGTDDFDGDGCFVYTAATEGQDEVNLILCDDLGVCDTTRLVITIFETMSPMLVADEATAMVNEDITLNVLENDATHGPIIEMGLSVAATSGEATLAADGELRYVPGPDYCGYDEVTYFVCNPYGCAEVKVALTLECDAPQVFTGFSPNGDGVNDTFVIQGLENWTSNELTVYNRWGNVVLQRSNYQNDWQGIHAGKDLPTGTYFYQLTFDGETITGFVQLER